MTTRGKCLGCGIEMGVAALGNRYIYWEGFERYVKELYGDFPIIDGEMQVDHCNMCAEIMNAEILLNGGRITKQPIPKQDFW